LKKVAITQRIDFIQSYGEFRDMIDQKLVQWITESGYLPFPVPNTLSSEKSISSKSKPQLQSWLDYIQPDAVLLSGGNNIDEYPQRDSTEKYLLSWAKNESKPLLGICRGLQMMVKWAGGTLVRLSGHVCTRHQLVISNKSDNWPNEVNSYHEFGIKDCPKGFVTKAFSDDGTIEAIQHEVLPWEGWMWHPERESIFNLKDINRLKSLF